MAEEDPSVGIMKLGNENGTYTGVLNSFDLGKIELNNLDISGNDLSADFEKWGMEFFLKGSFNGNEFEGTMTVDDEQSAICCKKAIK